MIILQILTIIYIFYLLNKTKLLANLDTRKKYIIYFFLVLVGLSDTQVTLFKFSFDFLVVGIAVILIEIILKNFKTTNYLLLKTYFVILTVLLFYRGGTWILQRL